MLYNTGDLVAVVFQEKWFVGTIEEQISDITFKVRVARDRSIGFLETGETLIARRIGSFYVNVTNLTLIKAKRP